jgi:TPP-dependent pyruvate/acetoin dehydrogenase alpha subunit
MLNLLRQGRISKWFSGIGQEAISVGAACALLPDEVIFTMHRNLGVFTARICRSTGCFANGKANAWATPKPATALSISAPWNTGSWA